MSQTNAAGGSVQYSWGSGGRCKPTSGVRKRTHFGNNVYKICFVCKKKNPLWGAPNCGGPGAAAPFAPLFIRHCIRRILTRAHADIVELQVYCMVELTRKANGPGVYYTASRLVSTAQQVCSPPPRHHLHSCLPEVLHTLYSPLCTPLRHSSIVRPKPSIATYLACSTIASLVGV